MSSRFGLQLGVRPAADDQGQVVVGGPGGEAALGADPGLEAAAHRQPAPVGVVAAQQRGPLVVLLGRDRPGHRRVAPVGPHDHPGLLGDGAAVAAVAADAGDAPVGDHDLLDGEPLAGLGGGVDQQLVERGAPGAVGHRGVVGAGRPRDGEGSEVEGVGADGWAAGGGEPLQQPPAAQRGHARRVQQMGRDGVAGERRPVHDQDFVAPAASSIAVGDPAHRSAGSAPSRARARRCQPPPGWSRPARSSRSGPPSPEDVAGDPGDGAGRPTGGHAPPLPAVGGVRPLVVSGRLRVLTLQVQRLGHGQNGMSMNGEL
jgi:hypothetical protein